MLRLTTMILCLFAYSSAFDQARAEEDKAEPRFLTFQLMTGFPGYAGPPPPPGRMALSKAQLEEFIREVVKTIGITGDARNKLGFAVGPLCLDMNEAETRQFIQDAFAVARENNVAVAFHIDDSMAWGQRKELLADPDNIETAGWTEKPNTGRRLDWGPEPTKFPPQMCFNSPAIIAAIKERAGQIGSEIKQELAKLKSQSKEHLFAGVIAGWESQIGSDFETGRPLGFRAMVHRGFSASKPPQDVDRERASIVKEFMELWANSLYSGGVPRERIFCHIAFTDQGLRKTDSKETYSEKVHFALPEIAFSPAYRPGFSTYPEGATFHEVHAMVEKHGSPGWISAEGTNVSPTSMPGEATMETYLGRMFNHGAVLVNIFAWGIGGDQMRDHFFRKATENPEAIAAYAKFLRGETLVESAPMGFSSEAFQKKMHRLQDGLPGWVQKSGRQAQVMPLTQKLEAFIKDKKWQEADKVADHLLALMKNEKSNSTNPDSKPLSERLPAKINQIQQVLPQWIQKTGRTKEASPLMKKLDEQLKSQKFADAEQTADAMLTLIGDSQPLTEDEQFDETRKKLRHELGGSFLISRINVQEELKVNGDQKAKIDQFLRDLFPESQKAFETIETQKQNERQQALHHYRQQANQKLDVLLKSLLSEDQRTRLRQLVLQREGLFGDSQSLDDLHVTQQQRQQFMSTVRQAEIQIEPLMKEAHTNGNPEEIRPKILKIRVELQSKLESFLTESQIARWKELLGKPFPLETLFD